MVTSSKFRKGFIVCSFRMKFESISDGESKCLSSLVEAIEDGSEKRGKGGLDARPGSAKINTSYASKIHMRKESLLAVRIGNLKLV
jgi:hypothetical protein